MRRSVPIVAALLAAAAPAGAVIRVDINSGIAQPLPIAVPAFATPAAASTAAGSTTALGAQVAQVIAADLGSSGCSGRSIPPPTRRR